MSFQALFNPRSVALIGASRNPSSPGHAIFRNLFRCGFKGVIYPVNPKSRHIEGVRTYPDVQSIDDQVDLAVIVVPRDAVLPVLEACGKKGIKAVVVITAGFKEIGKEGEQHQEQLKAKAQEYDITLTGPNCLGIINGDPQVQLNATFGRTMPDGGNVAFLSQSGAVGIHALEFAQQKGIGFSKFISMGNKAVLNETDYLKALQADEQTQVILLYLEHISDPPAFLETAKAIASGDQPKPLLVVKSGRTKSGQRASYSHTGALAESDRIYNFLFEQYGIIRVDSLEALFDNALCFARQPLPAANDVTIITNAGGPGIIAADTAEQNGLELPETPEAVKNQLKQVLPSTAGISNPIDIIGDADAERYSQALKTIIEAGGCSSLLVMGTPQMMTHLKEVAQKVCEMAWKAREKRITLATSFVSTSDNDALNEILQMESIPNYTYAENAIRSLAAANNFRQWWSLPASEVARFDVNHDETQKLLEDIQQSDRHFLTEPESYEVFRHYGFPVANFEVARQESDLSTIVQNLEFPVVAKVVSPDIVHKVDVSGVKVNINDEAELKQAYQQIQEQVQGHQPEACIHGILVQEMVEGGTEVIMGVNYDQHFGHLLMFGLGGTFVEIFEDVSFRLAPITAYDAQQMVEKIRSFPLLEGYRGKPAREISKLEEALQRLSQLVTDFPQIAEIDLNPVFALEDGIKVADARVFLR